MTKAANLANLAADTNYGILNPSRGGTGLGSINPNGALYAITDTQFTTGTLPVLCGGTGASQLANNSLVVGRGIDPVYTISPGSANNILISDGTRWYGANSSIVLNQLTLNVIGGTQAWTNVTGTRTFGTTYTNSTVRPIIVSVSGISSNTGQIKLTVGGVQVANQVSTSTTTVQGVVPANTTYVVATSGSMALSFWSEFR